MQQEDGRLHFRNLQKNDDGTDPDFEDLSSAYSSKKLSGGAIETHASNFHLANLPRNHRPRNIAISDTWVQPAKHSAVQSVRQAGNQQHPAGAGLDLPEVS